MSLAKLFIAAILAEGKASELIKHGPIDHLFKAHEIDLFAFVKEFVKQYQALPQPDTIEAHTGEELPEPKEPPAYYFNILQQRHVELELKRAMKKASDLLLPENKNPQAAMEAIATTIMELAARKQRHQIVDFRDAYDLVVGDYVHQWTKDDEAGIQLGWPTLDTMTGGLVPGDLVSFVGRPAKGKTMQMLYAAHHAWRAGRRVLFVSMEMKPLVIAQRLAALQGTIPMTLLKNADLSTNYQHKLKAVLTEVNGFQAPFWVVEGNFTATVEDIWSLARQLKPDVIFVDGAYLLRHPKERDRYKRAAENVELIKQLLSDIAPTICSWQFSRDAAKKAKNKGTEQVDLEDIGYTDVIGQVSSVVLGLFESDSPATVSQRRVEILKGRNGEVGHFFTRWDWVGMRFDELVEEPIEALSFV